MAHTWAYVRKKDEHEEREERNRVAYWQKLRADNYFATRPWWIAEDTFSGDWGGPGDFSNPLVAPKKEKKQVAVQVYLVTGEAPGHIYEVVLLAENEFNAIEAIKMTYGFTPRSCVEVKGPFKNGTILMMKQVKK